MKDDQTQKEGGLRSTGRPVRDRHAGALNKEPLPGYLIIVSHQWPK